MTLPPCIECDTPVSHFLRKSNDVACIKAITGKCDKWFDSLQLKPGK